jgi:hypothetical protein
MNVVLDGDIEQKTDVRVGYTVIDGPSGLPAAYETG